MDSGSYFFYFEAWKMHILLITQSARHLGGPDTLKSPPGERAASAPRRRAWIREDDARCPLIISISASRLLSYLAWPLTHGVASRRSSLGASSGLSRPRLALLRCPSPSFALVSRPPSLPGPRLRSLPLAESLIVYFPNSSPAVVMRINKMVIANPLV